MSDSNVATSIIADPRRSAPEPLSWQRVFSGEAGQVREARKFLALCLAGRAGADDAITCVSELAANAVVHSNSRSPGGSFTIRAELDAAGRLRVEVIDQGGPWSPSPDPGGQHGRGLLIVGRLSADWGITGCFDSRTTWFELDGP